VSRYSIGIDLGGTNLRAAAFDENGTLLKKLSGSTPVTEGPEAVIADMVQSASLLRDEFGRDGLAGIGAGVPGNIDMRAGVVVRWGNVPAFAGYPTRDELSKKLNIPVILENDANAAALGEHWMGAGRGTDDFLMLTLGTGIGGGIIHEGKIRRGHIGMAGEFGHITVVPNGNPCGCGSEGCVEKHAAAPAIAAMAQLIRLGDNLSAYDVQVLAEKGDERALTIWRSVGEHLGMALAILINIFNARLFLVGGGVSAAWPYFAPPMFAEIERRSLTFRLTRATTRIERATLGGDAGLYGAARLAFLGEA
jgi:glucokinase